MDFQMDPEMDLARMILMDPWQKKAVQGPFEVHIDQFLKIDLYTMERLKCTSLFEVNLKFGSGGRAF